MRLSVWSLAVLLAVLAALLAPCGSHRRSSPPDTSVSSGWPDWTAVTSERRRDVTAAVSADDSQLRALLLEVRQQLRKPDLRSRRRRRLKARKRRLREKLRAERAKRRRQRQQWRRHRARQLPTVLEEPGQPPAPSDASLTELSGSDAGALDDYSQESEVLEPGVDDGGSSHVADDSHRPTDTTEVLSEGPDRIGLVVDNDGDGDNGEPIGGLSVGEEDVAAAAAPAMTGSSLPAPAEGSGTASELDLDASDGSFLSSLWDWVSPEEGADGEQSPPAAEERAWSHPDDGAAGPDAGWTVPLLQDGKRPNIVLIMTDDLDVELGSLNYMPKLRRFLQDEGVTFRHGYVSTPLCCPSRSSYLTGMFIHNHHVYTNRDNCSSALWQQNEETRTYAAYLQQAGYRTGYFGKYMNRYDGDHIPAGWDYWSSLILNSKYYNYSMNVNGRRLYKGWQYPQDYLPLVIVNDSLSYFDALRREGTEDPVLMVLSFPAPHGPEDAAPEHTHLFLNATDHHTPSYDFAPNADKQWFLRHVGKMDAVERTFTDILMTKRLQTLQSVDDAIETVYRHLFAAGELDSTYILFTSDHGYHLGQFGVAKGKSYPFEFDIRVPFVVRGPGIRAGSRCEAAVLNVDVAPTLLEMAGLAAPAQMDGRSIVPLLAATDAPPGAPAVPWPAAFIVEGSGKRPDQRLRRRLQQGAVRPDDKAVLYVSALQRLQEACSQPEYHSPCKPYQKWACYHDGRRWRLQKCRRHRRRQQLCACRNGVVQHTQRIHPRERKDQLKFLKDHMNGDVRRMRMRFVKELREDPPTPGTPTPSPSSSSSVDSLVKQFVVEEDSSHVDDNIRRIGLELVILQSHVSTMGLCALDNTTCAAPDLRSRQRTVREQMQHLRRLLRQLQNIQRFLSNSAPRRQRWHAARGGRHGSARSAPRPTFDDSEFEDYADDDVTDDGADVTDDDVNDVSGASAPPRDVAFCPCRPLDDRAERQWVREYTKQARREERAQRRHERRKQKRRKQRKKALLASQNCDFEGLNCFVHDSSHWKTPPLWTQPPVCICVGASNGTFDCVRHVAPHEDWLYCRFVTGFLSFYDLTVDPYQLHNLAPSLRHERLQALDAQLAGMLGCSGPDQCRPLPGQQAAAPRQDGEGRTVAPSAAPSLSAPTLSPPTLSPPTLTTPRPPAGDAAGDSVGREERRRRRRREKHRRRHQRRINERARRLEWMRRLERRRWMDTASHT